ncbi:MAG: hypothetical protein AAF253_04605 [Pseudomonadota bacterium]
MLSPAFLRHAFQIVPFIHWPVLIWHIIMVHDWMARLTAAGEPIPFLTVRPNGVIYRRAPDAPADHWRNQLHSIDHARCTEAIRDHLAAHHGREAAAFAHAECGASPAVFRASCCGTSGYRAAISAAAKAFTSRRLAPTLSSRTELPLPHT